MNDPFLICHNLDQLTSSGNASDTNSINYMLWGLYLALFFKKISGQKLPMVDGSTDV